MPDSIPSAAQWATDCSKAGFSAPPAIGRALTTYAQATGTVCTTPEDKAANRALRLGELEKIAGGCEEAAKSTTSGPVLALLFDYGGLARKRMASIQKAGGNWGFVRSTTHKVLGSPVAADPALAAARALGAQLPPTRGLSGLDRWLEKLDPRHHSFRDPKVKAAFERWASDTETTLGLWEWAAKQSDSGCAELQEHVIYLAPDKQWENACDVDGSGLLYRLASSVGTRGDKLSTRKDLAVRVKQQLFYNPALWAYVISVTGRIYIHHHEADHFHHSSFLAGARVACAGMIAVSEGRILYVSNKSGHYQPSPADLYQGLAALKRRHPTLDFDEVVIEAIAGTEGSYVGWGVDFMAASGAHAGLLGPEETTDDASKYVGKVRKLVADVVGNSETWAEVPDLVKASIPRASVMAQRRAQGASTAPDTSASVYGLYRAQVP